MVIVWLILCYSFYQEQKILREEAKTTTSRFHSTMDYVDYMRCIKENTSKELEKLQRMPEFQKFIEGKNDPTSIYFDGYHNYDDIEEIVFSDEEEDHNQKA